MRCCQEENGRDKRKKRKKEMLRTKTRKEDKNKYIRKTKIKNGSIDKNRLRKRKNI